MSYAIASHLVQVTVGLITLVVMMDTFLGGKSIVTFSQLLHYHLYGSHCITKSVMLSMLVESIVAMIFEAGTAAGCTF